MPRSLKMPPPPPTQEELDARRQRIDEDLARIVELSATIVASLEERTKLAVALRERKVPLQDISDAYAEGMGHPVSRETIRRETDDLVDGRKVRRRPRV
jgi:hypothetical protein